MVHKKICGLLFFLAAFLVCSAQAAPAQESDQQINEFSLASFGEKGKKAWDLSGKSADIYDEVVKLKDVVGNLYGEKEDIKLTADRGDFDKVDGKVHLEENVVITTSSGARLTTDSLDWDRKKQVVATEALVNIERGNMLTTASGAMGEPSLKKISLEKDVTVNIKPVNDDRGGDAQDKKKIIITCDGPLEIDYAKNIATFKNNVAVDTQDSLIQSDVMDVYFGNMGEDASGATGTDLTAMGSKIQKIVARGKVKITRGENVSYSDEATYLAGDKKIILSGAPKLVIYSAEEMSASFGD